MSATSKERRDELLVGLALDALDTPEEVAEARRLLHEDPTAAAEVTRFREAAAELARLSAVPPPVGGLDDALRRIDALEESADASPGSAQPGSESAQPEAGTARAEDPTAVPEGVLAFRPRRRLAPWIAAAAAIAIAVPSIGIAVAQHQRAAVAEAGTARIMELLSQPGAKLSSATLASGQGSLIVVSGGNGTDIITRELPDAGTDRTYQLWTIQAGGDPVSAGLVGGGDAVNSAGSQSAGTVVAITLEPAGGSQQPTQKPIAAVTLG
ncbi:anti-sigma factor [Galactobacter valiniphilus]|uniref:anti-sigma factor n=1 Tax=Galactobacter valiniphilus TaxID=2676122 RepID=UPI003736ABCB